MGRIASGSLNDRGWHDKFYGKRILTCRCIVRIIGVSQVIFASFCKVIIIYLKNSGAATFLCSYSVIQLFVNHACSDTFNRTPFIPINSQRIIFHPLGLHYIAFIYKRSLGFRQRTYNNSR